MKVQPSKEQVQPTNDLIVVEPLEDPDLSLAGGIQLANPDGNAEKYGRVLAVGPGTYQNGVLVEPRVQIGDTVMFRNNRGTKIRLRTEDVLFMTERDFLAVVKAD